MEKSSGQKFNDVVVRSCGSSKKLALILRASVKRRRRIFRPTDSDYGDDHVFRTLLKCKGARAQILHD